MLQIQPLRPSSNVRALGSCAPSSSPTHRTNQNLVFQGPSVAPEKRSEPFGWHSVET